MNHIDLMIFTCCLVALVFGIYLIINPLPLRPCTITIGTIKVQGVLHEQGVQRFCIPLAD